MLLYFSLGSFSYTSNAGINLIWGVSLTYHLPASFYVGSFSYTSRSALNQLVSLTYTMLVSFLPGEFLLHIPCCLHFYLGVSLTHPMLGFFTSGLSLTPHWLYFSMGTFSYTSRAGLIFVCVGGVSLTHPTLASFLCGESLIQPILFLSGEFLLHIPCWVLFLIRGVCLRHPVLFSFVSVESLLNVLCCFIFIWGVSLTHTMLTLFLCGEFLLHNPCWLPFYLGVSLTYPTMTSILSGEFLLHIPRWLHFYLGSFSYTPRAGFTFYRGSFSYIFAAAFIFIWGVSLTHPSLASFLCGEFLLYFVFDDDELMLNVLRCHLTY